MFNLHPTVIQDTRKTNGYTSDEESPLTPVMKRVFKHDI